MPLVLYVLWITMINMNIYALPPDGHQAYNHFQMEHFHDQIPHNICYNLFSYRLWKNPIDWFYLLSLFRTPSSGFEDMSYLVRENTSNNWLFQPEEISAFCASEVLTIRLSTELRTNFFLLWLYLAEDHIEMCEQVIERRWPLRVP